MKTIIMIVIAAVAFTGCTNVQIKHSREIAEIPAPIAWKYLADIRPEKEPGTLPCEYSKGMITSYHAAFGPLTVSPVNYEVRLATSYNSFGSNFIKSSISLNTTDLGMTILRGCGVYSKSEFFDTPAQEEEIRKKHLVEMKKILSALASIGVKVDYESEEAGK